MKLRFLAAGASQGLVARVAQAQDVEVEGAFGPVGAMRERFLQAEACDVLILTAAQVAALLAARRVRPDTCGDLGAVQTAIAVRTDAPRPDVASGEALLAALLASGAIHFPDPAKATAGIHFVKVLQALGIEDKVSARLHVHPSGMASMAALSKSGAGAIGCTQATEIVATPGVTLVAPLPRGYELSTVYTAAVNVACAQSVAARAFVEALTSEHGAQERSRAGFEGSTFRRARPGDEAAVQALVHGILAEYGFKPEPGATDADITDLRANFLARGGTFDVGHGPDGSLTACCGVHPTDAATCELRKMYVRKDCRRQGLGARLLERALAFARARGYKRMELETASVLVEAMAMYEAAGFHEIDHGGRTPRCNRAYAIDLD